MRYATWQLCWQEDERYGTGPEPVIAERGGNAEGAFFIGPDPHDKIVAYVHDDVSLADLDDWAVMEISAAQALAFAQERDPEASVNDEGRFMFPLLDLDA